MFCRSVASFILSVLVAGMGLGGLFAGAQSRLEVPGLVVESTAGTMFHSYGPNENSNYLHYGLAREGRFSKPTAAISVGTFRSFNLAAELKRDLLVSLDNNPNMTQFNRVLAEKILRQDRTSFLRDLLWIEDVHTVIDSRASFEKAAVACKEHSNRSTPPRDEFQNMIRAQLGELCMYLEGYTRSEATWNATFFATKEHYESVRKMIREGRVLYVTGDIAGRGQNLAALARFLSSNGYVVSEFDISNAISYIGDDQGTVGLQTLADNIRSLPYETDSRVLTTEQPETINRMKLDNPKLMSGGGWVYLAPRFENFLKIKALQDHVSLVKAIAQDHIDACNRRLLNGLD